MNLWGHEARVAYSGVTALETAAGYQPDVLLLDIAMQMDGNQLARKLRHQASNRKLLLIAISGYADDAHRLVSAMAGFDHYLIKPVELLSLEELLIESQGLNVRRCSTHGETRRLFKRLCFRTL